MWIEAFAASTIVKVSTSIRNYFWPDDIWAMSEADAGKILKTLVKSSPNIQRLDLCPHKTDFKSPSPNPRGSLLDPPSKLWFEYLAELPLLRHLSLTNGWLTYPSLVAISRLGTLESLDLHIGDFQGFGVPHDHEVDINSDLSDDAFHSLRKLSLSRTTDYGTDRFPTIPKLLRTITELEVHVSRGDEDYGNELPGRTVTSVFPWLIHAPHLKNLRALCSPGRGAPYAFDSLEDLDQMRPLPLQTVELEGVTLGKGQLGFDLDAIWPTVT